MLDQAGELHMTTKVPFKSFYTANLNAWIARLPFPKWVFYLAYLILFGALQHAAAWSKGALQLGEFNLYLAFSAAWMVEMLIGLDYLEYGAGKTLDEFRPMLSVSNEELADMRYEFTMIPRTTGTAFFIGGAIFALFSSNSVRQVSPQINFIFPALTIGGWMFSNGLGVVMSYQGFRQLNQIRKFYRLADKIDLYNLSPVYAFSKMTALLAIFIFVIVYITPLLLNPTSLQSDLVTFQTYFFIALSLAIFYSPLVGVNRRLIAQKEKLLKSVTDQLETMMDRIHHAIALEDYSEAGGMRSILMSLKEERELIESIPTWPWRPATLRWLLSAILLPIVIWLIQQLLERIL